VSASRPADTSTTIYWADQRHWEGVDEGQPPRSVTFPLTVHRLVVEAGANRDFNAIHHNSEFARASGVPEMYASTTFLLGMWERTVREFIGPEGSKPGDPRVPDDVMQPRRADGHGERPGEGQAADRAPGLLDLEVRSENDEVVTVGPGKVTVWLPRRG
jgi:hypothetical protein